MKRWHPHSISTFLMVLLLMFGLAMPAFAEEWLDPTFGENGKVTTAFGEYTTDEVRDLGCKELRSAKGSHRV